MVVGLVDAPEVGNHATIHIIDSIKLVVREEKPGNYFIRVVPHIEVWNVSDLAEDAGSGFVGDVKAPVFVALKEVAFWELFEVEDLLDLGDFLN
jgi:hypothetical protein